MVVDVPAEKGLLPEWAGTDRVLILLEGEGRSTDNPKYATENSKEEKKQQC